jgi:hypothetical protein
MFGIVIIATLSLSVASAGNAPPGANVVTTDSAGYVSGTYNSVTQFNMGDVVYIHLTGVASGKTADIAVTNDDTGDFVSGASWTDLQNGATVHFTASNPGYYDIVVNGAHAKQIAFASIFILPESGIGTFLTIGTGFAALGIFGLVKSQAGKR